VLAAPRELDECRGVIVVRRIVAQPLVIRQAQPLNQQVPEMGIPKVSIGIGVQPWLPKQLAQDVILLEPGPKHGEIIENIQVGDVEPAPPDVGQRAFQEINDLTLARGRPADQDEYVECITHCPFSNSVCLPCLGRPAVSDGR
jgi:hypothetical protein